MLTLGVVVYVVDPVFSFSLYQSQFQNSFETRIYFPAIHPIVISFFLFSLAEHTVTYRDTVSWLTIPLNILIFWTPQQFAPSRLNIKSSPAFWVLKYSCMYGRGVLKSTYWYLGCPNIFHCWFISPIETRGGKLTFICWEQHPNQHEAQPTGRSKWPTGFSSRSNTSIVNHLFEQQNVLKEMF